MNLTYTILWFDDTGDFFDSLDLDPLKGLIREWGFEPTFELVTSPDELKQKSPYNKYDLIVVDYDLQEYGYGQDFIEKIRQHDVYTEIIFYSANPASDLWDAIREKELEGIFIANRKTVITKIESVANQSVKKVLDLENMRGIVMAEVGDIDHILESILEKGLASLEGDLVTGICERFHNDAKRQVDSQSERLAQFSKAPSVEKLLSLCTDSNKKWNNFQRLAKDHQGINSDEVGNYKEDVLDKRNYLAHGKPQLNEDGSYKFTHYGNDYYFNEDSGRSLRINIHTYKRLFNDIKDNL